MMMMMISGNVTEICYVDWYGVFSSIPSKLVFRCSFISSAISSTNKNEEDKRKDRV